jgi:hypothetical protein
MSALPEGKLTVDEYLAWAEGRPGRYELHAGTVYAMAPERSGNARLKFAVQAALLSAIREAGLVCHMLPDGMTVRIDRHTAHEPDALVYCGERLPDTAIEVPNPVVVLEVLSPSVRHIDASAKLAGYFGLGKRPALSHHRPGPARLHPSPARGRRADRKADCQGWRAAARPAWHRAGGGGDLRCGSVAGAGRECEAHPARKAMRFTHLPGGTASWRQIPPYLPTRGRDSNTLARLPQRWPPQCVNLVAARGRLWPGSSAAVEPLYRRGRVTILARR